MWWTFTLKHIVIGLLVREAANVADGRRQQTHVSPVRETRAVPRRPCFFHGERARSRGARIAEKPPSPVCTRTRLVRAVAGARVRANRSGRV